jgi:hypothetical protein
MTSGEQDKRTAVDFCIIVPYFPEKNLERMLKTPIAL